MSALRYRAPAKINLLLTVGPRRGDGLHELVSVMQAVDLFDEVSISAAQESSITVTPTASAPADSTNLAWKAAALFSRLYLSGEEKVALELVKRIPDEAGLGGGSSDAAAVLAGLKAASGAGVSRKALEQVAASLGSDVPFCVRGGTAVVSGTGEKLTTLLTKARLWWVIATPKVRCSTKDVYSKLDELGPRDSLDLSGDPHEMANALSRGEIDKVGGLLRNDLQDAALSLYPELSKTHDLLRNAGAKWVVLAGSGSSWLGLCKTRAEALHIAESLPADGLRALNVAGAIRHGPTPVSDEA